MSLHTEINFENDICAHLAAHGWLYAEGDAQAYDTPRALFAPDVAAWVQATQPQAWETLARNHGAAAEAMLLDRLRKQLDERGTLEVLRFGIEMLGLRQPLRLAQFKPALAMNPELQARYAANRLRVVRQRPATRSIRAGIARPTCGKRCGSATAGWRSSAATWSRGATARSRLSASCSRAATSSTPRASCWRRCWPKGQGRST